MKALTLRNLPPDLSRIIRQKAAENRTSLNKVVIQLLEEATGLSQGKKKEHLYHDLDALAGSWTHEEAAAFLKELARQRRIACGS